MSLDLVYTIYPCAVWSLFYYFFLIKTAAFLVLAMYYALISIHYLVIHECHCS